jgi:nicotinamide mononucleotide transporter
MRDLFSVDNIAINIWGYPMSYIELIGTLFNLVSVWLISQRNILTWPIGIIGVVLYMLLFYQIQLYSDTIEQIYFLFASIYGWLSWNKLLKKDGKITQVQYSHVKSLLFWGIATLMISIVMGFLVSRIHLLFPALKAASFPYLDTLTTIMSFVAMWLMIQRRIESWIYWIIVDVIGIGLYFVKDVKFVSLLYVIFLMMAMNGFSA